MNQRSLLCIYDMAGTVQGPVSVAWAYAKKEQPNLTLSAFKAQQQGQHALFPGMSELIRYTATQGTNLLLSDGNPETEGCPDLIALSPCFQPWHVDGKQVPFGKVPNNLMKVDPTVAKLLLESFSPEFVVVIGDSLDDYILAHHLARYMKMKQPRRVVSPVLFINRGRDFAEENVRDGTPPVFFAESGQQIQGIIQEFVAQNCPQNPMGDLLRAKKDKDFKSV